MAEPRPEASTAERDRPSGGEQSGTSAPSRGSERLGHTRGSAAPRCVGWGLGAAPAREGAPGQTSTAAPAGGASAEDATLDPTAASFGADEGWYRRFEPRRARGRIRTALCVALVLTAILSPLVASAAALARLYLHWWPEMWQPDAALAWWRGAMAIASGVSIASLAALAVATRPMLPRLPALRRLGASRRFAMAPVAGVALRGDAPHMPPGGAQSDLAVAVPSEWGGARNEHGAGLGGASTPDMPRDAFLRKLTELGLSDLALAYAATHGGLQEAWQRSSSVAVLLGCVRVMLPPEQADRVLVGLLRACAERALSYYEEHSRDDRSVRLAIHAGLEAPGACGDPDAKPASGMLHWVYDIAAAPRRMTWLEWKSAHIVHLAVMDVPAAARAVTVTRALAALEGYRAAPLDNGCQTYMTALCATELADVGVVPGAQWATIPTLVQRAVEAERARQALVIAQLTEQELCKMRA